MICANCGCPAGSSTHINPRTGGTWWCEGCFAALAARQDQWPAQPAVRILDSAEDLIERF